MKIEKSTRKGKRFMATYANGKVVHFGQEGGQTYIDHGDKAKREAYLARHKKRENWNDPYTPGSLSRWLLWGDSTSMEANHNAFMRKFGNL
tara:strand:+ start:3441 stop:3713 length:273 start_codon:yes stop_codon:yes gene_type:complete